MFSRIAKTIITSLRSRQIHIDRNNFKISRNNGELNRALLLIKNNTNTDIFGLYNEIAIPKSSLSIVNNNGKEIRDIMKTSTYEDNVKIFGKKKNWARNCPRTFNFAIRKLELIRIDAVLNTLLKSSVRVPGRLKRIHETNQSEINRWICMFSTKIFNSYLVCVREFYTFNKSQDTFSISALLSSFTLSKLSKYLKHRLPSLILRELHPQLYSETQNRAYEMFTRYGLHYLYSPCKVHYREFHKSLLLAKSESNKCKEIKEFCKIEEVQEKPEDNCSQPCKEKSDMCHWKKIKCKNSQQPNKKDNVEAKAKVKTEQKSMCQKTCFGRSKCDMPRTFSSPKMEYTKVTCPPQKFVKPSPCTPITEYIKKEDNSHTKISKIKMQKKQICALPSLPKPPCGPIVLCACPPPSKIHPGRCPCYEIKLTIKKPPLETCPLKKKKYLCPIGIHYCPPQQNNVQKTMRDLKKISLCDHKQKKAI